jgi:hypothetical protein
MRFQVPQYIDVKDKILGPLTLKQFMYYLLAILVLIPVYILADLALFVTIALPVAGATVLFVHGRFAGQSTPELLMHGFSFYTGTRLYIWQRAEKAGKLTIIGDEYDIDVKNGEIATFTSLEVIEQTLATQGNVVAQDTTDLIAGEEEGPESPVANEVKTAPPSPPVSSS